MIDHSDKSWLRTPPKVGAGDAFVALCILGFGGWLLYKLGVWA